MDAELEEKGLLTTEDGRRRHNVVGTGASTRGELRTRAKTATADEMYKWLLAEMGCARSWFSSSSTAASGSWSQPKKRSERFYLSWNRRVQRGRALLKALRPYAISLVLQCTA